MGLSKKIKGWAQLLYEGVPKTFTCPRRNEGFPGNLGTPNEAGFYDSWGRDNTCTYCGSANPDTVIQLLTDQKITITPTDKAYKIYLDSKDEIFSQEFRTDTDNDEEVIWTTRNTSHAKFYMYHLSPEQQEAFYKLFEDGKLELMFPGHFYAGISLPVVKERLAKEKK